VAKIRSCSAGFTLTEMVIVLALILALIAIAIPSIVTWRINMSFKQTASQMTELLRDARSRTVSDSIQYKVVFKPNSSSYKMLRSQKAYNSAAADYKYIVQGYTVPAGVTMRSYSSGTSTQNVSIEFKPNGTANLSGPGGSTTDGNICVNDGTKRKYLISVAQTGRISMLKK